MVTLTNSKSITPEEFLAMGSKGRGFELIDGELQETAMSMESSRIGLSLGRKILEYAEVHGGWAFGTDLGFQIFSQSNKILKPDVAYISYDRLPRDQYEDNGYCTIPPNLVIEVISPNEIAYDVDKKTEQWLNAGVDSVWEVHPSIKTVYIHRKHEALVCRSADTITNEPALPGFTLPVANIFQKPA